MNTIPPVTKNILIINFIVWLACYIFSRMQIDLSDILGLHYPAARGFYAFQFITYMFTHVDFSHLFFNMFAVFMLGATMENAWGQKRYLTYYMVTGIGAGIIQILIYYIRITAISHQLPSDALALVQSEGYHYLHQSQNYIDTTMANLNLLYNSATIGASGAVFGILLAFGMTFPNTPLFIMFIPIPVKAKYFVIGYGLIELFLGVANRSDDNVAHFAHLGGMLFGLLLMLYWKKKDKKNGFYH